MLSKHYPACLPTIRHGGSGPRRLPAEVTHRLSGLAEIDPRPSPYHKIPSRGCASSGRSRAPCSPRSPASTSSMRDSDAVAAASASTFLRPDNQHLPIRSSPRRRRRKSAGPVLAGDLGCLLNMAGKLEPDGVRGLRVRHVAKVLAGMGERARRTELDAPMDVTSPYFSRTMPKEACRVSVCRRRWQCCGSAWSERRRERRCGRCRNSRPVRESGPSSRTTRSAPSRPLSRSLRGQSSEPPAATCTGPRPPPMRGAAILAICPSVGARAR